MSQEKPFDFDAVKENVVRGAIFLVPGFLAIWVLSKVFGLLKELSMSVGAALGIELPWGGVLLDFVVIVAVIFICYLAGLIAERAVAQRIRSRLDHLLLGSFPGYAFIKGLAENIQQNEAAASSFVPVLVTMDDSSQVAFETDRIEGGAVAQRDLRYARQGEEVGRVGARGAQNSPHIGSWRRRARRSPPRSCRR
jgi:uncharacterized membrane protein